MAICSIGELCIDTMIFKDFNRIEKNEESLMPKPLVLL